MATSLISSSQAIMFLLLCALLAIALGALPSDVEQLTFQVELAYDNPRCMGPVHPSGNYYLPCKPDSCSTLFSSGFRYLCQVGTDVTSMGFMSQVFFESHEG